MDNNNSSDTIDNIAQSIFVTLIFCSLVSDSYIMFDNFLKNNYIKKKLHYCNKIYKIIVGLSFNNYKKDKKGNIIISNETKDISYQDKSTEDIDIQDKDIQEKDIQEKNIQEKDIQEKDIQEKDIQEKDIQEKDIQEKDIQEKDIQEKDIQDKDIQNKDILNIQNKDTNIPIKKNIPKKNIKEVIKKQKKK